MEYRDVVRQSIKTFMDGKMPEQTNTLKEEGLKYTPDFFDELEEDLIDKKSKTKGDKDKEDKDDGDS